MSTSDKAMQLLVAGKMAFEMPSGKKFYFRPIDLEDFIEMLPSKHFKSISDIRESLDDLNEIFLEHFPEDLRACRLKKIIFLLKGFEHLLYCLKEEGEHEQFLN